MKNKEEILQHLAQFYGTEAYHRLSAFSRMNATDGVKAMCEDCEAFWLFDAIVSHQNTQLRAKCDGFQVWKLVVSPDHTAVLTCDDGNGNIVAKQNIPYTDFPLDEMEVWIENGVALLPQEH